ncbi:MAG: hypothetical protein CSA81_11980 [Acidobacteria bacterium]|nr:MAG: hypothetical protein CSA81_11980 [Acidobacteriota bacterium]
MKTVLAISFFLCGWSVLAQNDMIANVNMQFQFSNPGARALGLGGAFVGLADDQTSIFANPAGLTLLRKRTVSFELLSLQDDHLIPFHSGEILQTGTHDLDFDLQAKSFSSEYKSIPFVSAVFPLSKINLGFFYAKQADTRRHFSTEFVRIPAVPYDIRPVNRLETYYFYPTENTLNLRLETLGGSAAWSFSDTLSVGCTVGVSKLSYTGQTALKLPSFQESEFQFLQPLFGETLATIEVDGDEVGFSGFGGFLYAPNDRFRFGLTYQHYPSFDYDYTTRQSQIDFQNLELSPLEIMEEGISVFSVPDNAAIGVSMRSSESLLLSAEIKRVFYSELSDSSYQFFEQNGNRQVMEDAMEYHFGLEYFLMDMAVPLSLRAGYWFEPYHALKNTLSDPQIIYRDETGGLGIRNAVFLQQFERDLDHLCAGLGLSFSNSLLIDLGIDISDETRKISLSGTWRY